MALLTDQNELIILDSEEEESKTETVNIKSDKTIKHPFFMAPAERAVRHLTQQISASNALNRAIRINLINDDEKMDTPTSSSPVAGGFFQKRAKVTPKINGIRSVKLKRISSSDPPPFPKEFQINYEARSIDRFECELPILKPTINLQLKPMDTLEIIENQDLKKNNSHSLSHIIKESFSDINFKNLQKLNTILNSSSLAVPLPNKNLFSSMYSEIDVALNSNQPVLWVLIGPSGVGKTHLIESLTESLNIRLITIDSTQSPRNAKTFETLQTTLSHSAPRSFSQFFSSNSNSSNKNKHKHHQAPPQQVSILFDEVEIAFESDRGYWSGLSQFLQSSSSQPVPIFITSNASVAFLESIIKFPDHVQFSHFQEGDHRKVSINSDFISRLHRIDTTIEYEHLALVTGYHVDHKNIISESIKDLDFELEDDYSNLIFEALRWDGGLVKNIHFDRNFDPFAYAEAASCADLLLSVSDSSVKIHLDPVDNLHSEFFVDDLIMDNSNSIFMNTLLFTSLPEPEIEIYKPATFFIAHELLERTIFTFTNSLNKTKTKQQNILINSEEWKLLSQKLSKRFFQYTRSLQSTQTWSSELLQHIILVEKENLFSSSSNVNSFSISRNRGRRKKAYYRIGEELLNELLAFNHEFIAEFEV